MKVSIIDLCGEYCVRKEQGRKLSLILESTMKMKETIILDWFGIRLLTTDFMEGAFSKLLKTYKRQTILSRIKLELIKAHIEERFKFNIDFFARYHNDKDFKTIIDLYFNPDESACTIKDLEVLPIEEEESIEEAEAEKSLYSLERMDVQPDDRPATCGGNIPS